MLEVFPTLEDLALAPEEEVFSIWSGLGFYRRARNLHRTAQLLNGMDGWPMDAQSWEKLPGVGPYTAAAILSICFNVRVPALDGNAYRVYSRLFGYSEPIDKREAQTYFKRESLSILSESRPGDSNQAIMDLGSEICISSYPKCDRCPLSDYCKAYRQGNPHEYPVKTRKKSATETVLSLFVHIHGTDVGLVKRTASGIWPELWCFPENPIQGVSYELMHEKKHLLSHRKLSIRFYRARGFSKSSIPNDFQWFSIDDLKNVGVPVPVGELFKEIDYI